MIYLAFGLFLAAVILFLFDALRSQSFVSTGLAVLSLAFAVLHIPGF